MKVAEKGGDMARRAVVAGGSGLIGRVLVASLLEGGWAVDVLTRDPRRTAKTLAHGAHAMAWDGRPGAGSRSDLAAVLRGSTAVVNLSGHPVGPLPWTAGRRRRIVASRVGSTTALVDAIGSLAPEERPDVLVTASGADIYTGRDAAPADEQTPPATDFLGVVCVEWEAAARAAERWDVRVVTVRTAVVVAHGAPSIRLLALPFRLFVGGRMGSGRQWFSWVHVDDVVGIYREAIANPALRGPVNAAAPEPVRESDLALALGETLRRPCWFATPAWPLRLALRDASVLVLGSRRVVPRLAESIGYVFKYADLAVALADVL